MSKFEDFKVGDPVAHVLIGDGKVTLIDEVGVHVHYKRRRAWKPAKDRPLTCCYSRHWFEQNPEYLEKRK